MNQKLLFEKTSPFKLFLITAIPGGISMLASSLYGILDGVFVGRILGEVSFAALNLAFPFIVINFSLADLIGVGSSVPISICMGEKKYKEANNIFSCSCFMIFITGIIMGILMYYLAPMLMRFLGANGDLAYFGVQYIRVYALCAPVTTIVFAMDNYLRICGKIKRSMFLNIFMSTISAILEFVFLAIFEFGIWGAAFATCVGIFVSALIAFIPFLKGNLPLHFCKPKFTLMMIRQIVYDGSPNFLSNIAGRITAILFNIVLLHFGGASAVSIYGILTYTEETFQAFLYGVCDSLQPAVGYNWGAKRKDRVKSIEKCCFVSTAIISLVSASIMFVFPKQIISLFANESSASLMEIGVFAMRLFSITFITRWFSFSTQSFMTAIGKPIYASILSISLSLILPILLICILWPLELNGIWLNFPITYAIGALLALFILLKFKKNGTK